MKKTRTYDAIIVGAGLAGLSAGLRLKKKGKSVLIIEKNDRPGGKLESFEQNGFRFDNGPSLLTEPALIDELFELFNKDPRNYFNYERQNESCRYFYPDGSQLTLFSDIEKSKKEITTVADSPDADAFSKYVKQAASDYSSIGKFFIENPQPGILDFVSIKYLRKYPLFLSKKLRDSLNNYNTQSFNSQKLINIFNRFGTYNGSNPYQMSGLYSMISSLELKEGSYFPKKGMRSIIDTLYQLAKEEGIDFRFNHSAEIEYQSKGGYKLKSSDTYAHDLICAIDHLSFYKNVLRDEYLFKKYSHAERSTSGLVFYWGIDTEIKELGLHNIIFSKNYMEEFDSLFTQRKNYSKPTLYIHVSSTMNKSDAPAGGQNLFIMINTSAYDNPGDQYKKEMKDYILSTIREQFHIDLRNHIIAESNWNNSTIEEQTGSYLGALYGASSNKMTSTFSRHPNRSRKYKNLYFCGGTVHPGGGIPLVLRSSKIVSDFIV